MVTIVLALLAWLLVSLPIAVVVGRGIAAADRRSSTPATAAKAGRSLAS